MEFFVARALPSAQQTIPRALSKENRMRKKRFLIAFIVLTLTAAAQQTETAIYNFGYANGAYPHGGLTFDSQGNLFGTATLGGFFNQGVVFKLEPQSGGSWTGRTIYNFGNIPNDGAQPYASLVVDSSGNVYGTTSTGGVYGGGTVFQLTPNSRGNYNETILHHFGSGTDGKTLYSNLIFDTSGNLYGTTYTGGSNNTGTVYELTPTAGGAWTETILCNFGVGTVPNLPYAGLIFDSSGNLYGTALNGGAYINGAVYKLSRNSHGNWILTTLHAFGHFEDGYLPYGGLAFDSAGNLYGTTTSSGPHYPWTAGVVYQLTPNSSGGWNESLLTRFGYGGGVPYDAPVVDAAGNVYVTLYFVGVLELSPNTGGGWTLNYFRGDDRLEGMEPYGGVILDSSGNIYGAALCCGTYGYGTVFEIAR
jgi:uncharacterized repeat protein (TIGR03803 family)